MKNYLCSGERIDITVPAGGLTSGQVYLLGSKVVVMVTGGVETDVCEAATEGVFTVPKATGAVTIAQRLFWDDTAKKLTTVAKGNTLAGYAFKAADSADATVQLLLTDNTSTFPQVANQAASVASTVAATVTDLNTLIAALKTAGLMIAD